MAAPAKKSQLFSTSVVRKYTLAAPAQWSQLVSTCVIDKVHFGRQTYKRSGSRLGRHGCHATGVSKWKSNRVRVSAQAEDECHARAQAKASEATLGIPLGSRSGRTRMPRKGLRPAEAIQLAHARPSCTSLGRVSQPGCNRASPTVFAVSCNGSPTVLIIEFGFGIHKQRAPKSLATPPLKAWQLQP